MHSLILMMSFDFWVGYLLTDQISVLTWHSLLSQGVLL
jgi:hypothetical protein